jgi:hypothetical protein
VERHAVAASISKAGTPARSPSDRIPAGFMRRKGLFERENFTKDGRVDISVTNSSFTTYCRIALYGLNIKSPSDRFAAFLCGIQNENEMADFRPNERVRASRLGGLSPLAPR